MEGASKVIDFNGWKDFVKREVCADVISMSDTSLLEREVAASVDENKIIEKYLDKIDQDRRDQEERISRNSELMEQRIIEERRLSEDRMEKKFNEAMEGIKELNSTVDSKLDTIDGKYENLKWWILGNSIATILAVAAMIYSK